MRQGRVVATPALVLDVGDGEVPDVLRDVFGHIRGLKRGIRVSGKFRVDARDGSAPAVPVAHLDGCIASFDELGGELTRGVVGLRRRGLRRGPVVAGVGGLFEVIGVGPGGRPRGSRDLHARANREPARRELRERVHVIRAGTAHVRLQHVRFRRAARRLHVVLRGDELLAPFR